MHRVAHLEAAGHVHEHVDAAQRTLDAHRGLGHGVLRRDVGFHQHVRRHVGPARVHAAQPAFVVVDQAEVRALGEEVQRDRVAERPGGARDHDAAGGGRGGGHGKRPS